MNITNGTKVKVVCGDRETVMFDPFGTVCNLNEATGDCSIRLGSCSFNANVSEIGESGHGKDIVLFDWDDLSDPMSGPNY